MNSKSFALHLKEDVEKIKAEGTDFIPADELISHLENIVQSEQYSSQAFPFELERYKAKYQKWLNGQKNFHEERLEFLRAAIQTGQAALKAAFFMTGGASIALLAFIGHLAFQRPDKVPLLATTLTLFVVGVLGSAIASGIAYMSQWFYLGEMDGKGNIGRQLNIAAIITGGAVYILFAVGIYTAYNFFANFLS